MASVHPAMTGVAVVGAGAAGLTAAIRAAEAGARVTLLNAHPRIGLKILMSGGTRCNVTHREVTERDFNGGSRAFVARILREFPADAARAWLESLGVRLKLEPTGKYFPESDDAQTVLDALLGAAERAGVELQSGAQVVRLERIAVAEDAPRAPEAHAGPRFRIGIRTIKDSAAFGSEVRGYREGSWDLPAAGPDRWIEARSVVIATGGLSFPRTGSDGSGYSLVASLGHTLEPPIPALTPLTSEDALCGVAQGVTLDAELTLWAEGKKEVAVSGSLLIAHFGYTGPAALDLSRHWLRAEGERRVTASFAPGETRENLMETWIAAGRAEPHCGVRAWAERWVPERLAARLCEEAGVQAGDALSQVDRARRSVVIERLVARDLHVTGTLGFEKAEVTAGGVRLSEVDPRTLESRVVPRLFLCGEILDVEGRLGGFNFQWSWSSGTVAGRSAAGVGRRR
jgi:hypothetical protein